MTERFRVFAGSAGLVALVAACAAPADVAGPADPPRAPAAAVPAAALPIPSQASAATLSFRRSYDFCVEVEGAFPKEAQFFQPEARGSGKYFIDIPACKDALMMDLAAKKVVALPRAAVQRQDDRVRIPDPPAQTASYTMSIDRATVQFRAEDKRVRVMPVLERPPIVGPVALADLIDDRPEYAAGMKAYAPHPEAIATLGKAARRIEIDAFFATWCSHCKEYMPKFLRAVQDARNPHLQLNLVGVPKGFGAMTGPWTGRGIQSIPTIIVKADGKEITRLGTHPGALPETELAGIVRALK